MTDPAHLEFLKQGVDAWNHWRRKHPEANPVLFRADLRERDFSGVNLSKADLTGATGLAQVQVDSAKGTRAQSCHRAFSALPTGSRNQTHL